MSWAHGSPCLGILQGLLLAMGLSACSGTIGTTSTGSGEGAKGQGSGGVSGGGTGTGLAAECSGVSLSPARIWRLTGSEYLNTVRDLFGLTGRPDLEFEVDPIVDGFQNNANALSVSTRLAGQLQSAAMEVAANGLAQFAQFSKCSATQVADDLCVRQFIDGFGRRAFRRPLSPEESSGYLDVYRAGKADNDAEGGIRLVVQTMLQSPYFLYRTELGDEVPGATGTVRLGNFELASALSYDLWGSAPDNALLDSALAGALANGPELEAQARRLLADPRANAVVGQFVTQWLGVRDPSTQTRDETIFPGFNAVKSDLYEEFQRLAESAFLAPGATLGDIFRSKQTFASKPLAAYYGISGPSTAGTFEATSLSGTSRAGLLTSGALIASWSSPTTTRPMTRGRLLLDRFLCQTMPPPPPSLQIPPVQESPTATTRERFEIHAESATCSACHTKLDSVAFALENYDAAGRYRTTENGKTIDASGTISETLDADGPFHDAVDLAQRLSGSQHARACLTRQYVRFASGTGKAGDNECLVNALGDAVARGSDTPAQLFVALVTSDFFRARRVQ
jgi:Protein of unknown function (DUF1592)/Protein of unknown function (DUF1588)/Protein of unknown function (DUF1595)/Protein of unknown function (DUF1587)/Protein of unknown function (DUF1585)